MYFRRNAEQIHLAFAMARSPKDPKTGLPIMLHRHVSSSSEPCEARPQEMGRLSPNGYLVECNRSRSLRDVTVRLL